jgi:hypothetical protein
MEFSFWKRIQDPLKPACPCICLFAYHQVSVRQNLLDLLWMIILLTFFSSVVSNMNAVNNLGDFAPEVKKFSFQWQRSSHHQQSKKVTNRSSHKNIFLTCQHYKYCHRRAQHGPIPQLESQVKQDRRRQSLSVPLELETQTCKEETKTQ